MNDFITYGIPDSEFIRGNTPMTKEEVRALSISKLRLKDNHIIADIGAGTGSMSIELSRIAKNGLVYAIEKNDESINLIKSNLIKFGVNNIEIIKANAPKIDKKIKDLDRIFIGGHEGNLDGILKWADKNLKITGRLVVNAVTIETLNIVEFFLTKNHYKDIEIIQVSISRLEKLGNSKILKANNPVFILSGEKG